MGRVTLGLAVATVAAIVIALFPLYADKVGKYIWSFRTQPEGERGEEATKTITGRITSVDPDHLTIVVDGVEIAIRGYWIVKTETVEREVWAGDLLRKYLRPGMEVTVEYREVGRWGAMAVYITAKNFEARMGEG